MSHDSTAQTVLFPEIFAKVVVAKFDQERSSSDGGALLLKAVDEPFATFDGVNPPGDTSRAYTETDVTATRQFFDLRVVACGQVSVDEYPPSAP